MHKGDIKWRALEYKDKEKGKDWFWALGIITASLAVTSIIYKNYLFALFIILATVVILMFTFRKPEEFDVEINAKGIKVKNDFYKYKQLSSFYINNSNPEHRKLIFHSDRRFMPHIILPIEENMEWRIKEVLLVHLKEVEITEPMTHRFMEYLGF